MADIPDMVLKIEEKYSIVNFKWVNDSSNSIYVSIVSDSEKKIYKLLKFNVGTCNHFETSKISKQIDMNPIREIKLKKNIDDFSFCKINQNDIFVISSDNYFKYSLNETKILEFFEISADNKIIDNPQSQCETFGEDQHMDIVENTSKKVIFAVNKFKKIYIFDIHQSIDMFWIDFDKHICSLKVNEFKDDVFLVLLPDMFAIFNLSDINEYIMKTYDNLIFHNLNWSNIDPNLFLLCGEFKKNEAITYSGFITFKRLTSNNNSPNQ